MSDRESSRGRVLVVAGSDPVAGAGLQADLKTITALGGYAMTAVTAVTVQDTRRVYGFTPLDPDLVVRQMEVCLADVGADCIKLGMLASRDIVAAVAGVLDQVPELPVVADPVLAAGGGGSLLTGDGLDFYRERLLPRVTLLTPNAPEAAALTGLAVETPVQAEQAARRLGEFGCRVLLTGGHLPGETITDLLWDGSGWHRFHSLRRAGPGFHGTGCTLASAVAAGLARGVPLAEAVAAAVSHVARVVAGARFLGGGQGLLAVSGAGMPRRNQRISNPLIP
ncbi:MAG: bifunctional hydroxymethylpyrimidine kinase/phosphomethylpyrimidine kinase [Magnetococcales bacterium]|nr:bifunctional hydroxymethylpyrimidine kinase/phosphomethylpyrimidine kinase [Magnetococcales bacterium]